MIDKTVVKPEYLESSFFINLLILPVLRLQFF